MLVHMCLPVWRELKPLERSSIGICLVIVHMCLPVWRELKPSYLSPKQRSPCGVHMCLPVWRELKQICSRKNAGAQNTYVHMCLPVWRELKLEDLGFSNSADTKCSHVPSRLEGIETTTTLLRSVSGRALFTCAFPFGGN